MSASRKIFITLPAGRIVAGSPTNKQTEYQGKVKEKPTWFFAVAVPKTDPSINAILQQIMQFAWNAYQGHAGVQQAMQIGLAAEKFAWKIDDGDDTENRQKEGRAGHWIFKFSTTLGSPPCFDPNGQPMDPALIKCGHWVQVAANIDINEQTDHTAGIYVNPTGVSFVGYAPEIRSGPSYEQMFGTPGQPRQLPPGVSATPVGAAPGVTSAPAAPGGGFGAAPPAGGAPGFGAPAAPQPPAPNAPGFHGTPPAPNAPTGPGFATGAPFGVGAPGAPGQPGPAAPGAALGGAPLLPSTASPSEVSAQIAAQHGVQHYPGHRYNKQTNAYEPDPLPAPAAPAAPPPPPPGGQPAAPAHLSSEQVAAQHGVAHYAGYRYNPLTKNYDRDAATPYPGASTVQPNHQWASGQ